jgi:hypothetical protein
MKIKWMVPILIAAGVLTACAPTASAPLETAASPETEPVSISTEAVVSTPAPAPQPLEEGLTYMREEEKLAHDVYIFLYDKWGVQIFQNIAASEQTHTDAVKSLLDAYNLPDPSAEAQPGQFSNANLQALYDQLTTQGSLSLADALKVGAAIEEIDILDLQAHLAGDLPPDVRLAYENLLSGSYNHLAAFTSTLLRQTGETYAPQYMTLEAYQEAINLANAGGNGNGNGYHGGRP